MVWDDGMKLKTLKDIEKNWDKGTFYEGHNVENPWAKILRKEAINWIKYYEDVRFWNPDIIDWIMKFFNIKDEELE